MHNLLFLSFPFFLPLVPDGIESSIRGIEKQSLHYARRSKLSRIYGLTESLLYLNNIRAAFIGSTLENKRIRKLPNKRRTNARAKRDSERTTRAMGEKKTNTRRGGWGKTGCKSGGK
jgi:hypothetical protein